MSLTSVICKKTDGDGAGTFCMVCGLFAPKHLVSCFLEMNHLKTYYKCFTALA